MNSNDKGSPENTGRDSSTGGTDSDGKTFGVSKAAFERGYRRGGRKGVSLPQKLFPGSPGTPFVPPKWKAPEIHVRWIRGLEATRDDGEIARFPVDDDGTCRAGHICVYVSGEVRHVLRTVSHDAGRGISTIYCPENLPLGAVKSQLLPNRWKLFVTRGEGYLPPIAWNEDYWLKYLPRPTKPVNAYLDPYYTDPRWWDDSGETPAGANAVELVNAWNDHKAGRPVEPHFAAIFARIAP